MPKTSKTNKEVEEGFGNDSAEPAKGEERAMEIGFRSTEKSSTGLVLMLSCE